ncbi:TPA: adhesin [Citrobacter amalonaticus]|uniref:hypothetical protein n=1 Tax=Citrobacter amalonaticus TaxID=35703 RepID=UPI0004DA030A|nr:hypothetical protein [Citrobacter amalonaticus]KEY49368.1 hypothetical protein DQ02_08645 [Citrobacter amalonaticus]MBJ9328274.1 adhesin [Citrobacter amalonaticus]HAU4368098.1 adhesin [Citrobacter amalonaticus]HCD7966645.1 adhesin [Citrobacter amalonaticus]
MLKSIVFLAVLMSSSVLFCIAAERSNLHSDALFTDSFKVNEIADLGHPVCTLTQSNNTSEELFDYVEGDICPVGSGACTYSAIIKLNGKMLTLKRIQSDKTTSTFKNNDISITTIQSSLQKSNMEEEGNDVKLSITIRARNSEKKFYLSGYCGI